MPLFDEREKSAERKFEHDQELAFKITARRNKLLGLWAAAHLGLAGEKAEHYAREIVQTEVTGHGEAAVIARICADFVASGFPMTEQEVRRRLDVFRVEARNAVMHGTEGQR
jgi:hypothetical protein